VGKVLRRTSLDELPQLWNILRGDMSFVGPRAWADYELECYKDWHYRRLEVTPGLTGLAQISGRSALSFDQIIRLDIDYIDRRSIWLDFEILLKTVPVALTGSNTG
jgi:lipopolysaccharide/colanic/teichoic acid biosynthesis glycosyltransferase